MPGTTSTALPSFSHDQHHETDAAKRKGGGAIFEVNLIADAATTLSFHLTSLISEDHSRSRWVHYPECYPIPSVYFQGEIFYVMDAFPITQPIVSKH